MKHKTENYTSTYVFSAVQQEEVKQIYQKYRPPEAGKMAPSAEEEKMEHLRKLDKSVTSKILDKVQAAALDAAMEYVLKDPARNFTRLVDWTEHFDIRGEHASQIAAVRPVAEDPGNNWNQFVVRLCDEVDHEVLKATVRNFSLPVKLTQLSVSAACF